MIAKRQVSDYGCGCAEMTATAIQQSKAAGANQNRINDCKYWCDKFVLAGVAWCAKVFKRWDCQTGCIFAVDLIKDGCYWCCSEGNFYEKCVQPFEDILSYMGQPCDPYWD
jgi:hypothetical protein